MKPYFCCTKVVANHHPSKRLLLFLLMAALAGFLSMAQLTPVAAQDTSTTLNLPAKTINPSPANGAVDTESTSVTLSWQNGGGATMYDVYVGTYSPTLTYSNFMGTTTDTTFRQLSFIPGVTVYWRVDARNADGVTPGDVWFFTTTPPPPLPKAINPSPADGSAEIPINPMISWENGGGAEGYYILLGTSSSLTYMDYYGQTTEPKFYLSSLVPGQTYYWRIDSNSGWSQSIGDVWSFTTTDKVPPKPVMNVYPYNNQNFVPVNTRLEWRNGGYATSYDVYFGTSATLTESSLLANVTETSYNLGELAPYKTYYWRVDAKNSFSTTPGTEWHFTTSLPQAPGMATDPSPASGSIDQPLDTKLQWKAGEGTDFSIVYFSESSYFGWETRKAFTKETAYNPGPLAMDKTYYWKVDTLNPYGQTSGEIWNFSTPVTDRIEVTSPESGYSWPAGSSHDIQWTSHGEVSENVSISLFDAANNLVDDIASQTENDGSFTWDIPETLMPESGYRIMIASEDELISDVSDAFSITAVEPKITVVEPAERYWQAGKSHYLIRWSSQGPIDGKLCIKLYKGGNYVETIAKSTPNNGVYTWHIPKSMVPGFDYQIGISEAEGDNPVSAMGYQFRIFE